MTGYNNTNALIFSELTASSGYIPTQVLTEYMQNASGKYYQTNYTINATKTGYVGNSTTVNLTQSIKVTLTISSETIISSCQDLTATNMTYKLNQNVSSAATCFNIKANGITLDCLGYTINYSQSSEGYAVNITNYNDTTIKNCTIVQGSTSTYAYGIYAKGPSSTNRIKGTTIINNNIVTHGDYSDAVLLQYADLSLIHI